MTYWLIYDCEKGTIRSRIVYHIFHIYQIISPCTQMSFVLSWGIRCKHLISHMVLGSTYMGRNIFIKYIFSNHFHFFDVLKPHSTCDAAFKTPIKFDMYGPFTHNMTFSWSYHLIQMQTCDFTPGDICGGCYAMKINTAKSLWERLQFWQWLLKVQKWLEK